MKMKRSEKLGMFTGLVVGGTLIADQRVYDISDNMQSLGKSDYTNAGRKKWTRE